MLRRNFLKILSTVPLFSQAPAFPAAPKIADEIPRYALATPDYSNRLEYIPLAGFDMRLLRALTLENGWQMQFDIAPFFGKGDCCVFERDRETFRLRINNLEMCQLPLDGTRKVRVMIESYYHSPHARFSVEEFDLT